ncbi:MAG: HAD family hydrolase [Armatimonadetes bacterium]|nr:HAD family hydrolase [Armatimonadota bacterium]
MIRIVAFDADDTLWHNESIFALTHERYTDLLTPYHPQEWIESRLFATETRNLNRYGYGIKGFMLSMIETAIELTEGRITGREIESILEFGREMLVAPIQLLSHVEETLPTLAQQYPLLMLTKGDLFDQETKVARSGLADHFRHIEIVSEKDKSTYEKVMTQYNLRPDELVMVGNSMKSDILPVLELGAYAVHIPYHLTWAHEKATLPETLRSRYLHLEHVGLLPELLKRLDAEHQE